MGYQLLLRECRGHTAGREIITAEAFYQNGPAASAGLIEEGGNVSCYCRRLLHRGEVRATGKDSPSLNVVHALQIAARRLTLKNGVMSEDSKCRGLC